jgi:subtilisin family serine protease
MKINKDSLLPILATTALALTICVGIYQPACIFKNHAPKHPEKQGSKSTAASSFSYSSGPKTASAQNSQPIQATDIQTRKASSHRPPSPLSALSPAEAERFPQGVVIDHSTQAIPGSRNILVVRVIDSASHLGYVRAEEIIDPATNSLINRNEMRANTLIVKLQPGMDPKAVVSANPSIFLSYEKLIIDQPLFEFKLASHDTGAVPIALDFAKNKLTNFIVYAEPNGISEPTKIPNDPNFEFLWGLQRIQCPLAWDIRSDTTSFPVVVAVVDTGVDYGHEDLSANMWKNPLEIPNNSRDDDGNGYIDDIHGINALFSLNTQGNGNPMDIDGHGTHVAGTIAAVGDNAIGVVGVSWNLIKKGTTPQEKDSGGIMALKCLGSQGGTAADIAVCINYAVKQGAKIINLSLGGPDSTTLRDAVSAARSKGIILVAAAGNDGLDVDVTANKVYPACYEFDNIVTVGASNESDLPSDFSNFGKVNVDVFAPGVSILSTFPRSKPKLYDILDGTSMAAPHVSGALALLVAQYPSEGYKGTISRLYGKADKVAALQNLCVTGARVNLNQSIRNISVRPTPTPREIPNLRVSPVVRGTVSRDAPGLLSPAQPVATPTPRATATPFPVATPRPTPTRVSPAPPAPNRISPTKTPPQTSPRSGPRAPRR